MAQQQPPKHAALWQSYPLAQGAPGGRVTHAPVPPAHAAQPMRAASALQHAPPLHAPLAQAAAPPAPHPAPAPRPGGAAGDTRPPLGEGEGVVEPHSGCRRSTKRKAGGAPCSTPPSPHAGTPKGVSTSGSRGVARSADSPTASTPLLASPSLSSTHRAGGEE